jgi:amino acid permease
MSADSPPQSPDLAQVRLDGSLSDVTPLLRGDASPNVATESEPKLEPPPKLGIVALSGPVFNLLNVIVGVGILGLPFVFSQAGLALGFILLVLVALGTAASFSLLLDAAHYHNSFSYEDISEKALGFAWSIGTKIIIILDTFGTLAAFLVVVADSTFQFTNQFTQGSTNLLFDKRVLLALNLIIIIPLSLLKNINALAFTSALSLLPLVYLIVLQIIELGKSVGNPLHPDPNPVPWVNSGIFVALPIAVFAFSSQLALFPIYNELKERKGTLHHMNWIIRISIMATIVTYSLCGIFGVITFPTTARGNILLNYGHSVPMDILLIAMTASVVLGYPLTLFPCREAIDRLMGLSNRPSYVRFAVQTMLIITLTYTIAALVPSFSTILGLSGAITKTAIGYLLPPLFYLKSTDTTWRTWRSNPKWVLAIVILVLGTSAGIISTVITIKRFVDGEEDETISG